MSLNAVELVLSFVSDKSQTATLMEPGIPPMSIMTYYRYFYNGVAQAGKSQLAADIEIQQNGLNI